MDRRTSGEQVADVIRREILLGRIEDREELNQVELAAALGISRMPVRDALRQLENECFVERLDNRHTRVIGVTQQGRVSRYRLLSALETEAALCLRPEQIEEIGKACAQAAAGGAAAWHFCLHSAIFTHCPDRYLTQVYRRLFAAFIRTDFERYEDRLSQNAAKALLSAIATQREDAIRDAVHACFHCLTA